MENRPVPASGPRRVLSARWLGAFRRAAAVLAAAFLFLSLVAAPVRVKGTSMENTLRDKDFLLVTKFDYLIGDPERFDVVICRFPDRGGQTFVKRIVGVPGDTVEIRKGILYVNREAVREAYVGNAADYALPAYTVPEGQYYVLGDNRPNSNDSHRVGTLSRDQILAKVRLVLWPPDRMQKVI